MKLWATYIYAKCNVTGEMKTYGGPNIPALTRNMAIDHCKKHYGYLHVQDEVIMEVPCKKGTLDPDFDNAIDYSNDN